MTPPRVLRDQLAFYERHGFHAVDFESAKGSHFKVKFAEFGEPQFLSKNVGCPRALRNNVSRFRQLAAKAGEKQ